MRNLIGVYAELTLKSALVSTILQRVDNYQWMDKNQKWQTSDSHDHSTDERIKAIYWKNGKKDRIMAFNLSFPYVYDGKNIDITLFNCRPQSFNKNTAVKEPTNCLLHGELKGGFDPAGADEHWKTGNTALSRIRTTYKDFGIPIKTVFLAAAIEKNMSTEIYDQLSTGTLSFAGNITKEDQLMEFCSWVYEQ